MSDNRRMLVEGYRAKPVSNRESISRGLQASANQASPRPSANQLPRGNQSSVKPAKKD